MGDPCGVGPEILAQALGDATVRRSLVPVVFGDGPSLLGYGLFRGMDRCAPKEIGRVDRPTLCEVTLLPPSERVPGKPGKASGHAQLEYIQEAVKLARKGHVDALCTAPVSKEQITRSGVRFVGHTELLATAFRCDVMMLMDGPRLRVALATNHLPITQIAKALSVGGLASQLDLLSSSLAPSLGRKPRIAVCGLNPHAGDGGVLGTEEERILAPAVRRAKQRGVLCEGPISADGLFAKAMRPDFAFDVVLAMYHDQGLIPAKAFDFHETVNVTLGLPLPRTSPDHGVAYDIAGRGLASAKPMIAALLRASDLAMARRSKPKRSRAARPRAASAR